MLTRLRALVPIWPELLLVAFSALMGASVAIGVSTYLHPSHPAAPIAAEAPPAVNQRFTDLGQLYLPQLGTAYASAWEDGAKDLDAGKEIPAALDTVAHAWTAARTELYGRVVTPELAKVVPEGVKDSDVTPAERAAMAAAWRGLARGLKPQ
jgi:hypothetical protein